MKTFARIQGGEVMEIIAAPTDIGAMFHPSLHWVDVTGHAVKVGWRQDADGGFAAPPASPPAAPPAPVPTLADVLAEVAALKAQIAKLQSP